MPIPNPLGSKILVALLLPSLLFGCEFFDDDDDDDDIVDVTPEPEPEQVAGRDYITDFEDWPLIIPRDTPTASSRSNHLDEEVEQQVQDLLSQMSLEEKIGQMIQGELQSVTPEEAKEYHLGSILNGGGSWPNQDKYASLQDWLDTADAYWEASMDESDGNVAIPLIWGTDAVHGHSNVVGATLFPHNIGLGAANDPDLIRRIGEITAKEVAVTGIDWTFAPTLAVVQDDRWGRTYEGYSEDAEIVFNYAGAMVDGLQGDLGEEHVVATAKHWVGDGGTTNGKDQGLNESTEYVLRNVHAQGYFSSLYAGAQAAMASFNSWENGKLHGDQYMLTEVLKGKMGFSGLIVGDWNGHGQVDGCSNMDCPAAINAGIDLIMVPADWKAFYENTLAAANSGEISMERIDDAVSRILRVKIRAGMFTKPKPSERALAGDVSMWGSPEHRAVAREAVRKSLVLLKNTDDILPLSRDAKILVAGKSADSLSNQSGGWTISWQGTGLDEENDFPGATSILKGIQDVVGEENVTFDESGESANPDQHDLAIVVIGETPYAEGVGDIGNNDTLEHARLYPEDVEAIQAVYDNNVPVVTVFVAGRPLYTNKELNRSEAFVVAWLPGSEGGGVSDLLFENAEGETAYDYQGRLSFSWPDGPCATPLNVADEAYAPLFPFGYGLTYADTDTLGSDLEEVERERGCNQAEPGTGTTNVPLDLFTGGFNNDPWVMRIGAASNGFAGTDVNQDPAATTTLDEMQVTTEDGAVQFSAKRVKWTAAGQIYMQHEAVDETTDLSDYFNSNTSISFGVKVYEPPVGDVNLAVHCVFPCLGELALGETLRALPVGVWETINVPLSCFVDEGLDITAVNTPWLVFSTDTADIAFEEIRWLPETAPDDPDCDAFAAPTEAIDEPVYEVFTDALTSGYSFGNFMNDSLEVIDDGSGNNVISADLALGTNVSIHKDGLPADLTAYDVPSGKLEFDVYFTAIAPSGDVLVKMATDWPNLSDIRLFADVLESTPALNTWVSVEVSIQELMARQNSLAPGNFVDLGMVTDILVLEAVDGTATIWVDNVRLTKDP